MAKWMNSLFFIIALGSVIFLGIRTDGYSQERPAAPAGKPVVQESPATQAPQPYPRMKRRGLTATVNLDVTPPTYTGPCPAVFTLKGQIYANKAMTVLYKIVRSDNMPMEPIALTFEKEGWKEITYTRQIGDSAKSAAFNEWAIIEVVYPVNVKIRSNAAILKGSCGDQTGIGQQTVSGQQGQSAVPTGLPGPQPQGRGSVPPGFPMSQPGEQKQLPAGSFPMTPPGQGVQSPSSLPMSQPGQAGQGPGGMPIMPPVPGGPGPGSLPMPQPGQAGQMPGGMPVVRPGQAGQIPGGLPVPGNVPASPPDVKTLPGAQK